MVIDVDEEFDKDGNLIQAVQRQVPTKEVERRLAHERLQNIPDNVLRSSPLGQVVEDILRILGYR